MTIGPFAVYAPPGVYTHTSVDPGIGLLLGGLRVPVVMGPAKETISQTNYELIRGSSSVADTPIFGEDASGRWVVGGSSSNPTLGNQDGFKTKFKVRSLPIVDGTGSGRTTYEPSKLTVTVNGQVAVVKAVDGAAGTVELLTPVTPSDVVLVSYFFHRGDTRTTDNVSSQVTTSVASLLAPTPEGYNIVTGTSDKLLLLVNDTLQAEVTLAAGTGRAASDVAQDVNQAGVAGLQASVQSDSQGKNHVLLVASGNIQILAGNANAALGFSPGTATNRTKTFTLYQGPVVDGSGGGITATDPSRVVVLVNGAQVVAAALDGQNRQVTLPYAPFPGVQVTIQYFFNTFQDTFDYLPNNNVTSVSNVGIAPGRRDYLNGPDFVVINDNDQSKIHWGTTFTVVGGDRTGSVSLDSNQIVGSLVDDRMYAAECARYVDPVVNATSTTQFVLPGRPTTGNGRDTSLSTGLYQTVSNGRLDLATSRPDLVQVYVGKDWRDASTRAQAVVLEVDSATNRVTLRDPVPADYKAFATFWYNRLSDDQYTFSVLTSGPSGVGTYSVSAASTGAPVLSVRFGTKSGLSQTVQFPSGSEQAPNAFHTGDGAPVAETVTVTFSNTLAPASHASVTNALPGPYDLYNATRQFGGVVVDGNAPVTVDLSTGFKATLLGKPLSTTLAPAATDYLLLQVDSVQLAPLDISGVTTMSGLVAAINALVDADVQTHTDGTGTFASTAPNALASVVTYGTESFIKMVSRSTPTTVNGLHSNVKVLTPTGAGQTQGAAVAGFLANQAAYGSSSALNQGATLTGALVGPFTIGAALTDSMQLNVDGNDLTAQLPAGTVVTTANVANALNAAYVPFISSADAASMTTSLVTLANDLRTRYEAHRVNTSFHSLADSANIITAGVASNLSTAITLLNDLKTKFNAHRTQVGIHPVNDTTNVVSQANATDMASAMLLAQAIATAYSAHRTQATVHTTSDTTNVVTATLMTLIASVGAGKDLNKLLLSSRVNTPDSNVLVKNTSTAATVLGFSLGASASRTNVSAEKLATALNAASAFAALATASAVTVQGLGTYLQLNSRSAGSSSSVAFSSVSNTSFLPSAGLGIVAGTTGDTGAAAQSGFNVTSSQGLSGSHGTGFPGQTYTDATTGLRFTVLPASSGDYTSTGSFTLNVATTFRADAGVPTRSIPGVETFVYNTVNMNPATTAVLSTFARSGAEPTVGEVYYISYEYNKADFSTQLYREIKKIQQAFGPATPDFPLSLGARIAILNGAVLVGLKQIPQSTNLTAGYLAALDDLRKPISGSVLPDMIAPLTGDPTVLGALNQHCIVMSAPQQKAERTGTAGVSAGTSPVGAAAQAQALSSELMILNYPDSFVVSVADDLGNTTLQLADGTYMAAAIAGIGCNPSLDVATPLTRRQIQGFDRLGRVLDPTEANQVAVSGVTVIEQVDNKMRVRHGLTTNTANVITRTPSVTWTIHHVQQLHRQVCDPYIGQKLTGTLIKSIETDMVGMFNQLIGPNGIVTKVVAIEVAADEDDPTVLRTSVIYIPVFPLEYIVSEFAVRVR